MSYRPYNPVVEDFTQQLDSGIGDASQHGKVMGSMEKGKNIVVVIPDNNMAPALKKDDKVTIKSSRLDGLKVGNLVFYRLGSNMVVRRVIRSVIKPNDTYLITKADNISKMDKPVKASQIVGKVIKLERNGRNISVPSYANIFQKMTCYGTIPFHQALFKALLSVIPFVHPKDDIEI